MLENLFSEMLARVEAASRPWSLAKTEVTRSCPTRQVTFQSPFLEENEQSEKLLPQWSEKSHAILGTQHKDEADSFMKSPKWK